MRELCLRLKHERNAWLAPCLSELWAEARAAAIGELPPDAWIVPVPLHWRRHWTKTLDFPLRGQAAHRLTLGLRLRGQAGR